MTTYVFEEKNFWDAFLRYATIIQMAVLASLMAIYDVWPQTWPAVIDAYLYAALSLFGLASLTIYRGHYSGKATAVLYSPLAFADIGFVCSVRDVFINISGSYVTRAYPDGPALGYSAFMLGLLLWAFWTFGLFYFYALWRAFHSTEDEIMFRTPTAMERSSHRRLEAVGPALFSAYFLLLAAYSYRRSGLQGNGLLFRGTHSFVGLAVFFIAMLDVYGAYKRLVEFIATALFFLCTIVMREIHSANYCTYLRCLERHTEAAEDYCVEVYYASYSAMVATVTAGFMCVGWRVYASTKRITTSPKEHQL